MKLLQSLVAVLEVLLLCFCPYPKAFNQVFVDFANQPEN